MFPCTSLNAIEDCYTTTNYGLVEGSVVEIPPLGDDEPSLKVEQYLSVPYAEQPVGPRRFCPLKPLKAWKNTWVAKDFRNAPIQASGSPLLANTVFHQGEDCAWLNIWKPAPKKSQGFLCRRRRGSCYGSIESLNQMDVSEGQLPVLVFMYGGGFHNGSSCEILYQGHVLAALNNIIVVTFNYRLGVLGFLHIPDVVDCNLGIHDQQVALKWVHSNIGAFNGDPNNITLAGHSAGASSVFYHYLNSESRKYFSKAFAMSGCFNSLWAFGRSKGSLVANSNKFLKRFGGNPDDSPENIRKFLQSLPFSNFQITLEKHNLPFGPTVEGLDIEEGSVDDGKAIPLLATLTANEGDFFTWFSLFHNMQALESNDPGVLKMFIKGYFGSFLDEESTEKVVQFYSKPAPQDRYLVFNRFSDVIGDTVINGSHMRFLNRLNFNFPQAHVFFGVYDYRGNFLEVFPGLDNVDIPEFIGCTHGVDVPFLFGHLLEHSRDLPDECLISCGIQGFVTHFMRTGQPLPPEDSGEASKLWPSYEQLGRNFVYIYPNRLVLSSNFRKEAVDFWDMV